MMRHGARRVVGLAIFLLMALQLVSGMAATVPPPAHIEAELPAARLAGAGNFRYFGFDVYDAQLWVGAGGYRPAAPTAEKIALDLRYARTFAGKKIAAASIDEMKKLNLGTTEQRADWLARMEALFPDVRQGTHLTGVYLPNKGVRYYHDGKLLGEIADPEFARAFFAIWLDPKTTAGNLRTALLADAAPR